MQLHILVRLALEVEPDRKIALEEVGAHNLGLAYIGMIAEDTNSLRQRIGREKLVTDFEVLDVEVTE